MKILLIFSALVVIAEGSGRPPPACEEAANPSRYECLRFYAKFEINSGTREVRIVKNSHLQCVAEQPAPFYHSLIRHHPTRPRYESCQDVKWHAFHNDTARFGGQRALEIVKELRLVIGIIEVK